MLWAKCFCRFHRKNISDFFADKMFLSFPQVNIDLLSHVSYNRVIRTANENHNILQNQRQKSASLLEDAMVIDRVGNFHDMFGLQMTENDHAEIKNNVKFDRSQGIPSI